MFVSPNRVMLRVMSDNGWLVEPCRGTPGGVSVMPLSASMCSGRPVLIFSKTMKYTFKKPGFINLSFRPQNNSGKSPKNVIINLDGTFFSGLDFDNTTVLALCLKLYSCRGNQVRLE